MALVEMTTVNGTTVCRRHVSLLLEEETVKAAVQAARDHVSPAWQPPSAA